MCMGYRIEYNNIGRHGTKKTNKRAACIAAVLVLSLVFGAIAIKSIGLTWVKEVLLPGDPDVTAAALEALAEDLRNGESIADAVKAFCQEIVNHGTVLE